MRVPTNLALTVSLDCHRQALSRRFWKKKIHVKERKYTFRNSFLPRRDGRQMQHSDSGVLQLRVVKGTNKTQAVTVGECQCHGLARKVEG